MSDLFEKSMRTLELPAVLEMLAQRAVSDEAKERCRRLRPSTEPDAVSRLLDETDAAKVRLGLHGSPSFTGVKDVAQPLNRADHGGMLNTRELLDIAGVLTATRRVSDYDAERQGEPTAIDRLFSALRPNKYLEDRIRGAILDEETIADTASPELADIRRQMRVAATKGRQILQRIISSPSYAKVLQEALITQRDGRFVVPVTVELGGRFDTLVITGPNTGGKTVTLKTIGLLSLMAQCGLHIPAGDQSAVQVFDRILADVGDEQSIEQSLSTFSAHMANTVEILKQADDRSLILFDELGAGTDPVEGAALAIAIIQDVRGKGALTAATTHYAELKTFAMTTAGVENASCEFDVQTLRPTYRLLIGIPGKSNAFAISRRLGLDESVIEAAKAQMDSESVRFEDVLTQLEEKRQRLEKAQNEADRLWQQREEDARKARTFREQMEKAKENARTKGEAEARRIVRQAQQQADQVFAELDQLRKQQQRADYQTVNDGKADVRRRLKEAEAALHQHDEAAEPIPAPSRPIAAGDTVELAGVRTAAAVLAVNGDGTLLLQAGKMKMTVKASQVRLLETAEEIAEKKKQAAKSRAGGSSATVQISTGARASAELDIRGLETLEAESVVENYLDAAQRSKLGTVTIIHGKGTGALRAAVHQMLKKNRAVKSFRLGRYGEGEAGVTVVELK